MFEIVDYKRAVDGVLKDVPEKTRDILSRRFGIKREGQKETLESIGKDYDITRERIRQIEKKGIETLKNSPKFSKLKEPVLKIKYFIDENGGLKREDLLESSLTPRPKYRPYLLFLLKLGEGFSYKYNLPIFHPFWETKIEAEILAKKVDDFFIKLMEKERKLFKREEILEIGKKEIQKNLDMRLKDSYILSYIEVSRMIEASPFGEYGLASWPEISLRGVRDKAYLILKKEGRPLHFRELARLIEGVLETPIQINTLHNELIKDENFVLVGRGIYALQEWGYKEGTVREVIREILKERGELSKEEILNRVREQRMVKESTIVLNLQYFQKTKEGKYTL